MSEVAPTTQDIETGIMKHPTTNYHQFSLVSKWLTAFNLSVGVVALCVGSVALSRANRFMRDPSSLTKLESTTDGGMVSTEMSWEGSPTLYEILERGKLNCGITISPGFGQLDKSGKYSGFDVDLCRAMSSAIFGNIDDPDRHISFTVLPATERFNALAEGKVDMLARITTFTMERDVYVAEAKTGFSFSTPYLYDGHRFAGNPEYVICADSLNVKGDCSSLKVCVNDGTTTLDQLKTLIPDDNIVVKPSNFETETGFVRGDCNVIFAGSNAIAETAIREAGHTDEYEIGTKFFSHEPLALTTRDSDPAFSDFVNWVLQALISANEQGITRSHYKEIPTTSLFGGSFSLAFRNAIGSQGNYREIYARNLHNLIPRGGLNAVNRGNSGLILSVPFGDLESEGSLFHVGSKLDEIKKRGHVNCGVESRVGFAEFDHATSEWRGLDVDLCKSLSAAIFDGVSDNVVFHSMTENDRFRVLSSGIVDVLTGVTQTYQRDVHEPSSKKGFSFSQPYFYDGLTFSGIAPFGSCADNLDVKSSHCEDLQICVHVGTDASEKVFKLFPHENIVFRPHGEDALAGLKEGHCNAVATDSVAISKSAVLQSGLAFEIEHGSARHTKDPMAMVTRDNDSAWSDFVYWVLQAAFYAEENGITSSSADMMPSTKLFGDMFMDMLRNPVEAVGNYDEMYTRNLQAVVPRSGLNLLNSGSEAQMYALPGVDLKM